MGRETSRVSSSPFAGDRRSRRSPAGNPPPRRSRSPTPLQLRHDGGRRRFSPYNHRPASRRPSGDNSSGEEDLKGLTYFEYRRIKRQRLRKKLKNCIWRITPSPPGSDREEPEESADSPSQDPKRKISDSSDGDSEIPQSKSSRRRGRRYSDSSETESEADYRNKRKASSRNSRKKRSKEVDSDSESESESESESSPRARNRRSSKKKSVELFELGPDDVEIVDADKPEIDPEAVKFMEMIELQKKQALDVEPQVGPMPLPRAEGHISYGGALRPGEGDAIAQ